MMLIDWLRNRADRKRAAAGLYQAAYAQSRDPAFYESFGVADTMDGRFDLLSLHVYMIMAALDRFGPEGCKLGQKLFDHMFVNVDYTLREIGVGDLGVPKHMKKMMKAFNGRIHAYHDALATGNEAALQLAVTRNIYRVTGESIPQGVDAIVAYIFQTKSMFDQHQLNDFKSGAIRFPEINAWRKEAARA